MSPYPCIGIDKKRLLMKKPSYSVHFVYFVLRNRLAHELLLGKLQNYTHPCSDKM